MCQKAERLDFEVKENSAMNESEAQMNPIPE